MCPHLKAGSLHLGASHTYCQALVLGIATRCPP